MTQPDNFESDDVLKDFFEALSGDNIQALRSIHIPRSDVFYVRQKYFQDTGSWVSLDRMERAMLKENMINAHDVKDPNRVRDWEKDYAQFKEDYQ